MSLSRDLAQRIARSVHRTEAMLPYTSEGPGRLDGSLVSLDGSVHHRWVRLTSNTLNGDGHYPGLTVQLDLDDNSMDDEEIIWIREASGGVLHTTEGGATRYYWGRMEGDHDDDIPIFMVSGPGAGAQLMEGALTFPATSSTSVAPTGYVTVSNLTQTGTPTSTLAEGSLLWNSVDNTFWVSLGAGSWVQLGAAGAGTGAGSIYQVQLADGAGGFLASEATDDGTTFDVPDEDFTVSKSADWRVKWSDAFEQFSVAPDGTDAVMNLSATAVQLGGTNTTSVTLSTNAVGQSLSVSSSGIRASTIGNSKGVGTDSSGYFKGVTPAADGTYTPVVSITIENGIITAIS